MQETYRLRAEGQLNRCVNPSWMKHHLLQRKQVSPVGFQNDSIKKLMHDKRLVYVLSTTRAPNTETRPLCSRLKKNILMNTASCAISVMSQDSSRHKL